MDNKDNRVDKFRLPLDTGRERQDLATYTSVARSNLLLLSNTSDSFVACEVCNIFPNTVHNCQVFRNIACRPHHVACNGPPISETGAQSWDCCGLIYLTPRPARGYCIDNVMLNGDWLVIANSHCDDEVLNTNFEVNIQKKTAIRVHLKKVRALL